MVQNWLRFAFFRFDSSRHRGMRSMNAGCVKSMPKPGGFKAGAFPLRETALVALARGRFLEACNYLVGR